MISIPAKRYQLALWTQADRQGEALRLEFDSREEAERAFTEAQPRFQAGVLVEWNKRLRDWTLRSQYPN